MCCMNYNIKLKEVLEYIENDLEIKNIYKEVEEFEVIDKGWAFHNFIHVCNVMNNVSKILIDLNYDEDTIISSKIACLLHDTGARFGKNDHEIRSYEYAKEYFEKHNFNFKNKDLILNAIKNHSNGFECSDIITLSLIFADKLDIKKNRISEEGKKIVGNRQYAHIEDIKVEIRDGILFIYFYTDGEINIDELNEYYFTKKVFKAICSFSLINGLKHEVLIDNVKLEIGV